MNTPLPLSIVIPARDEADRIGAMVAAHRWAAEIIVVDNGSTDRTTAIAAEAGARVIAAPGITIGAARNRGADAARHQWILALDADERVDGFLVAAIAAVLDGTTVEAWRFRRVNRYLGRDQRFGALRPDWVTRLYRPSLRFSEPQVHESLQVERGVGTLPGTLYHEPYRDLAHHLDKIDRYARWGADDLRRAGRLPRWGDLAVRPAWRFVRTWILRGGILEGRTGWIASRMEARSVRLKYLRLRERSTPG